MLFRSLFTLSLCILPALASNPNDVLKDAQNLANDAANNMRILSESSVDQVANELKKLAGSADSKDVNIEDFKNKLKQLGNVTEAKRVLGEEYEKVRNFGRQFAFDEYTVTPTTGISAIVLLVVGSFLVFFGIKFFKICISLIGACAMFVVAMHILGAFDTRLAFGDKEQVAYFSILGVSALIGAAITFCIWKVGLIAIGALAGYAFSLFFFTTLMAYDVAQQMVSSIGGRLGFTIVLCIIGVVLVYFMEKLIICLTTSLIGTILAAGGADFFMKKGFLILIKRFVSAKFNKDLMEQMFAVDETKYMLIGVGLFFAVGFLVQYFILGRGITGFSKK